MKFQFHGEFHFFEVEKPPTTIGIKYMTERQILLIKNTWSYVMIDSDEVGEAFYEKLFELDPSLKALFKIDLIVQRKKLISMLTYIILNIQRLEEIVPELEELGKRHVSYGTKPGHYLTVCNALLFTLQQELKDKWDSETAEAWELVYNYISTFMQRGSY